MTSCVSCGLTLKDKAVCLECYNELVYERDQLASEIDRLHRLIADLESRLAELEYELSCTREDMEYWKERYHRLLADAFIGD